MRNEQKFVDLVLDKLGFRMENSDKVNRAVNGTPTSSGLVGGVGEDAEPLTILAKYDELGGYITKDGYKVKNRVFFDAKTKAPNKDYKVVLLIRMNGEWVEYVEGEKKSIEMQVAMKQTAQKENLERMSRKELDKLAKEKGLNPDDYSNRGELLDALKDEQTED